MVRGKVLLQEKTDRMDIATNASDQKYKVFFYKILLKGQRVSLVAKKKKNRLTEGKIQIYLKAVCD